MAREPVDATQRILRQIQETLGEHSKDLAVIKKTMSELRDGMITALGMAANANIRHDSVDRRLDDLTRRVEKLEEKV